MNSVETVGKTILLRCGDAVIALSAKQALWIAQHLTDRANDIQRREGPTQTGKDYIQALKALYGA